MDLQPIHIIWYNILWYHWNNCKYFLHKYLCFPFWTYKMLCSNPSCCHIIFHRKKCVSFSTCLFICLQCKINQLYHTEFHFPHKIYCNYLFLHWINTLGSHNHFTNNFGLCSCKLNREFICIQSRICPQLNTSQKQENFELLKCNLHFKKNFWCI